MEDAERNVPWRTLQGVRIEYHARALLFLEAPVDADAVLHSVFVKSKMVGSTLSKCKLTPFELTKCGSVLALAVVFVE